MPEERSVQTLLSQKMIGNVLKSSGKQLVKQLISADFARALTLLDLLFKVKTALELDQWKRLVSEQRHSRRDEAERFKLRFFIRLWIADNMPQADRVKLAWRFEELYFACRKALGELWKYEDIEKNLAQRFGPNYRRPPTMGPA